MSNFHTPAAGLAIELQSIELSYGKQPVLQVPHLVIPPGQKVALVGPSGAGKSTLLGIIGGTRIPQCGKALLSNQQLLKLPKSEAKQLRRQIGVVYQQLNLVDQLKVKHNALAGSLGQLGTIASIGKLLSTKIDPQVMNALEQMRIGHLANSLTANISGGEKQRVALARILVQNPALVLADEPVASLDEKLALQVIELLTGEISQNRTLVVSMHNFDLAIKYFERVVALKAGRIFFDSPASQVSAQMRQELYANH